MRTIIVILSLYALATFAQTHPRIAYECGAFGIDNNPWRGNVRNQGQTGACWAFATIAFVESAYRALTCNNMYLSVEQVIDGVENNDYMDCGHNPGYNGGYAKCALEYIAQYGIMTEYMYPFTNGGDRSDLYDVSKTTPIGIRDITQICNVGSFQKRLPCAYEMLHYNPIIASICASDGLPFSHEDANGNHIIVNNLACVTPNHAVLITKIWEYNAGEFAIEYQNSYGDRNNSKGFEVMLVRKDTTNELGPRSVFSQMFIAQIYDENADAESLMSETSFPFPSLSLANPFAETEQIAIAALVISVLIAVALIAGVILLAIKVYRIWHAEPSQAQQSPQLI